MYRTYILMLFAVLFCVSGCASVSLEAPEVSEHAKQFNPPAPDHAGLYIYRSSLAGAALKKDIWVNGECLGESANNVFFYHEVPGGTECVIATESEFSPNELRIMVENGVTYFIEQYIKMGAFVGGANLKLADPEAAKEIISKLNMAVSGNCSQ